MAITFLTNEDEKLYVKTINGNAPDENGNVKIEVSSDSGQNAALTTEQVNALNGMFKVCAFTKGDVSAEYSAFLTAFGISDGGEEEPDTPVEPDDPAVPEVTLSSISAVYSGGSVAVGTAVTALTGVVVTAHYSDGSTATVTGYTLSGTIAEGNNTVTVFYEGMTTTFTVVGVAESGGDDSGGGDVEEPGEIVYYAGYQINSDNLQVNSGRCMAVQSAGEVPFKDSTNIGLTVYPIDIPAGITRIKVTSPSPAYINTFKIIDGVVTFVFGSGWLGGWKTETKELDLTEESYAGVTHFCVGFNVGNGNGVEGYDFSGYVLEFE